jgi:peptide/nickel transport system substrate-binding protein
LILLGSVGGASGLLAACTQTPPPPAAAPAKPAETKPTEAPKPAAAPTSGAAPTTAPAAKPAESKPAEAAKPPPKPAGGSSVTVGYWQGLLALNVHYTTGGGSLSAAKLAQRGLLFFDEASNWAPELAVEVPSLQNGGISADGKTISFKLRPGVTWHDGKPVTAADVRFTWEAVMNPQNKVISRYGYDQIGAVDMPDEQTAVLRFKEPFASWATLFDALLPKHLLGDLPDINEAKAQLEPIGFGPYKIAEVVSGSHVIYEAFDGYWRGRPKVDRLFLRIFPSVEALVQAVRAKEVDVAWALPVSLLPELQALDSQGIKVHSVVDSNPERYVFNMDPKKAPLFADKELRRALHLAVDRQTIVDKLLFGQGRVAATEWDNSPWENTSLPPIPYDPEESKRTLDRLGWTPGPDGIRVKDGQRLSFTHATTVGNQLRENVQLLVQQNFKDVGAEMEIKNERTQILFATYGQGGKWARGEYMMGGWSHGLRMPDPDVSNRYVCREIASDQNPAGAQWYHYCNPEIDKLFDAQAIELDVEKRRQILFKIQEILHDEYGWIWLYDAPTTYAVNTRVKNFKLQTFGNYYWNAHAWEVG